MAVNCVNILMDCRAEVPCRDLSIKKAAAAVGGTLGGVTTDW